MFTNHLLFAFNRFGNSAAPPKRPGVRRQPRDLPPETDTRPGHLCNRRPGANQAVVPDEHFALYLAGLCAMASHTDAHNDAWGESVWRSFVPRTPGRPGPFGCGPAPLGLLLDRGFTGEAFTQDQAAHGRMVVVAPNREERRRMSWAQRRPIAAFRNRIETTNGEITEQLGLAHHHAHTFWGLLTRTAATPLRPHPPYPQRTHVTRLRRVAGPGVRW
ncbi:hypothetical protein [Streptomyces sp. NPDC003077]|uniref:hypothetical protein n=1 Tax=Streptomyces sp. NPDC003077 TaxID=3154443 RepID=UPI0033AFF467